MDRTLVMMRPNATQDQGTAGLDGPGVAVPADQRVIEDRKRYTTQLQRRAQAHVTAELGIESGAADIDRQIAMLLQHALEQTGARRVTLFRPVAKGQRWHAAIVLEGGGYYYGLIAPESLVLPMSAYERRESVILASDRPADPLLPRPGDLGLTSYLGVPILSGDDVVAVIEAIDVARPEQLDLHAAELERAIDALADTLASESRRHGWQPSAAPARGLSETTVLDLVLRPSIDPDDTFEVSPQEWLLLNQLNGERELGEAASLAGAPFGIAATVAASLLQRGLIRLGKEARRRA